MSKIQTIWIHYLSLKTISLKDKNTDHKASGFFFIFSIKLIMIILCFIKQEILPDITAHNEVIQKKQGYLFHR